MFGSEPNSQSSLEARISRPSSRRHVSPLAERLDVDLLTAELQPCLAELESKRRRLMILIVGAFVLAEIAAIGTFGFVFWDEIVRWQTLPQAELIFGSACLGGLLCIVPVLLHRFLARMGLFSAFGREFKAKAIAGIVKHVGAVVCHETDRHLSGQVFADSGLFSTKYEEISGGDFVQARSGNKDIYFSQLVAWHGKSKQKGRIFRGLFLVVMFPLSVIYEVGTSSHYGHEEYLTDYDSVDDNYELQTSDPKDAERVLENGVLQCLRDYQAHTGHGFDFGLKENKLFVAFPDNSGELLRPPILRSIHDPKIYERLLLNLSSFFRLIEALEANRQIWASFGTGESYGGMISSHNGFFREKFMQNALESWLRAKRHLPVADQN